MKQSKRSLTRTISLPITEPLKALIEELAKRDDRKPTEFSRRLLKQALAEEAAKAGLHKEAEAAGLQLATSAA